MSFAKLRVLLAARHDAEMRAERALKTELRSEVELRDGMQVRPLCDPRTVAAPRPPDVTNGSPLVCATRALQLTIARTGHDLKSPVTAMGMALEAIMQRLLAAKTPQPLSTSPRGGNGALLPCAEAYAALIHLRMIVNRSQDYARILAHVALKPSLRAVNVLNVVRSVVQWKALSADVSVVIEPPPAELVEVGVTDASWLEDNLLCVIDNACKVTRRGSGAVGVSIRTVIIERRKLVDITVKDRGEEALSDAQVRVPKPCGSTAPRCKLLV